MAQNTSDYYTKREVMIPMRDGTRLYTAIYEPTDSHDRHPILMARTPYGCHPYGKEMENLFAPSLAHYAREGYIFVFQDVRGMSMSEGTYENVRPVALAKGQRAHRHSRQFIPRFLHPRSGSLTPSGHQGGVSAGSRGRLDDGR